MQLTKLVVGLSLALGFVATAATPWCEFCAVEMLMRMVVCAAALAMKPMARPRPTTSLVNCMVSPEGGWLRAACGAGCGAGLRRALQKLWRCSMAPGIGVCAGKHAYQRRARRIAAHRGRMRDRAAIEGVEGRGLPSAPGGR